MTINYLLSNAGITAESMSVESLVNSGMDQVAANIENARFETVLGFFTYRMNVFGGVIVGLIIAFYKINFIRFHYQMHLTFLEELVLFH